MWWRLLVACLIAASADLTEAATIDEPVLGAMRGADPVLVNQKILYRNGVAPDLELVIAIGSPAEWPLDAASPAIWWDEKRKIGLFLQETARPARVYSLALAPGSPDCGARIERATSTDTVISCTGEKGYQGLNQKFVYDVRARTLSSHFAYQPFAMRRVLAVSGRTLFMGSDLKQRAAVEFETGGSPELRIVSDADGADGFKPEQSEILYFTQDDPAPIRFGPSGAFTFARGAIVDGQGKDYQLPQSSYDDFAKARRRRVTDGYVRNGTIIEEKVGPAQLEGYKLWFGKTFYDGEGNSGVGGFGYFDATDRQFHEFAAPEIADYSVSAIRVEPDAVWMAVFQAGEYGGSPAGVLRYDRATQAIRTYELRDAVYGLAMSGGRMLAATSSGVAVIYGDKVSRFFIDRTADGQLRIAEAIR